MGSARTAASGMSKKAASELRPGDTSFTDDRERAKIVEIRPTNSEVRSRKGQYGMALMILHHPAGKPDIKPLHCSFVHPDDMVEIL